MLLILWSTSFDNGRVCKKFNFFCCKISRAKCLAAEDDERSSKPQAREKEIKSLQMLIHVYEKAIIFNMPSEPTYTLHLSHFNSLKEASIK